MSAIVGLKNTRWMMNRRSDATAPLGKALADLVKALDALKPAYDRTAYHAANGHFSDPAYTAEEMAAQAEALRIVASLGLDRMLDKVAHYEDDQGLPVLPLEMTAKQADEYARFNEDQERLFAAGLSFKKVGQELRRLGWELER